jgi:D-alanine--poly(phosphoribitol) ligase subunit 2
VRRVKKWQGENCVGNEEKVREIIHRVIDQINLQLAADQRLEKGETIPLFGEEGRLDSLGLVNLIVGVEGGIAEDFGTTVNLADEQLMARQDSPFRTVGSLVEYVTSLL